MAALDPYTAEFEAGQFGPIQADPIVVVEEVLASGDPVVPVPDVTAPEELPGAF
jgi:hypothetical protein